jgi:hypothetical protein
MSEVGVTASMSTSTLISERPFHLLIVCRATKLNHTLASLLWDLSGYLDNEYRRKIHSVLESVGSLFHDATFPKWCSKKLNR